MKLKDFLNLPFLKTPSERNDSQYFPHISGNFKKFHDNLEQVENFPINDKLQLHGKDNIELIRKTAKNLCNSIRKTFKCYNNGQPAAAYLEFKKGLEASLNLAQLKLILTRVKEADKLFRIRPSGDRPNFEPWELFHISMTQREIVRSQRFSIPGYPCLYLSNSIFLCWLEMGKPDISKYHASFFQVINDVNSFEEIYLLDLTNILRPY